MTVARIHVSADPGGLASVVAEELLGRLGEAQQSGGEPQVALTGGSIADAIHREVARLAPTSRVDWSRVGVWWGDERFVAADSPDRNARQARASLLDVVGATSVHEMPSADEALDAAAGASAYAAQVRAHGGGEFALVMLGVGHDGHVASLFPGYPQLDVDDEIAVAVTDSPKPPPERITLTLPALNRARAVWFVVSGADKALAVARAIAGDAGLPASRVRGRTETVWFLDSAAASHL